MFGDTYSCQLVYVVVRRAERSQTELLRELRETRIGKQRHVTEQFVTTVSANCEALYFDHCYFVPLILTIRGIYSYGEITTRKKSSFYCTNIPPSHNFNGCLRQILQQTSSHLFLFLFKEDSRFRRVKWIGGVPNVLGAVEHSESESGEEVPWREITRNRTKLKSRCSCGYRFSLGISLLLTPLAKQ